MEAGGTTVADLVEAAAGGAPASVAVVAGGRSLTYAELDGRANRLAHHLQRVGVGPDVPVGVCLPRSLDLAVALVAVLKAGGACVPLDPAFPPQRLAFMAADSGLAAVLTCPALADRIGADQAPRILVDADAPGWAGRPATRPARRTGPSHLGYLVYTSGSTGQPKGVMLTHRGLVNHHRAVVDLYRLTAGDRVLQFCSLGFDASIEELFPTWAAGATVVFRPEDVPLLGRSWLAWLREAGVTVLNLPTAYWQAWARDLDDLGEGVPDGVRLVVVGGDKALGPTYRAWQRVSRPGVRWVNAYGPTETTCMSTFYEAPPEGGDPGDDVGDDIGDDIDPPIGRPLANTTVLVVDEALRPVAGGDTGELLIGGAGLARGYRNHPGLTAERFVSVETEGGAGAPARMYRTGDLVRRLPSGDLAYVGRVDDQVKIQGFRVECAEVEAALSRHPGVASAAVVARGDPPGDRRLVAYVVAGSGRPVRTGDLRRFLADRLPAHMVPAAFTVVDQLPLTPNGKLDRDALPSADGAEPAAPVVARTPAEDRLAEIWARVLGIDAATLAPADDFFDLGGHSLLATQVVAQVREEFATQTPLRAVFEAPTLAALAAVVEAERDGAAAPGPGPGPAPLGLERRPPGAAAPLSLAQEQMWALERAASPPGLYNFTAIGRFDRPVDVDALRAALAHLVDRHEILRTGVASTAAGPRQTVAPAAEVDVELIVCDLRSEPAGGREAELHRRIAEQEARPFEPSRPPLLRVGVFHLGDHGSRVAATFDHLVSDGTGATVFFAELAAAYAATCAGRPPSLPPLAVQFADFALWQRTHVTEAVLARQLAWWTEVLAGVPTGPAVAVDHLPVTPTRRVSSRRFAVGAATRAGLEDVARATGGTLFTLTAAATAAVLSRIGGETDVVLSTTVSGRTRAELEGLVGMFSGMSRIRVDTSGDPPFTVLAARARQWVLGMFEHQDVPFLRVRRAVQPDFPTGGRAVAAALPVELQYFHGGGDQEFFFRGQLHPLSVTFQDDGTDLAGELRWKLDFYEGATVERLASSLEAVLRAVAADPSLRLSALPVSPPAAGAGRS